jgi:hypothetical protein
MKKFDFYGGIFLASMLLPAAVIVAEMFAPFKNLLTSLFTHHWIGKLAIVIAAFVAGGYFLRKKAERVWYVTLGSLAAILLFFMLHYFIL